MLELKSCPEIHYCGNFQEFVDEMDFSADDVIFTSRFLYEPYLKKTSFSGKIIFQEDYGSGEPTDLMAESIIRDYNKIAGKRLIAIGGGTVIDLAKIVAVSRPDSSIDEMFEIMPELKARCLLEIVPTTCGTGSEVTNVAILERTRLKTKMGIVADSMFAKRVFLVPDFLQTLPYNVFATSSLDALAHSVESFLSSRATSCTKIFSAKALEILLEGYSYIKEHGHNAGNELYGKFLQASNYAGIAFGTAGCGAVHAMSYPLGAAHHVPHGEANYSLLMEVLDFYEKKGNIVSFNSFRGILSSILRCQKENALEHLALLLKNVLPLKRLHEYGMTENEVMEFPPLVLASQQRLLGNAPFVFTEDDIRSIYRARY